MCSGPLKLFDLGLPQQRHPVLVGAFMAAPAGSLLVDLLCLTCPLPHHSLESCTTVSDGVPCFPSQTVCFWGLQAPDSRPLLSFARFWGFHLTLTWYYLLTACKTLLGPGTVLGQKWFLPVFPWWLRHLAGDKQRTFQLKKMPHLVTNTFIFCDFSCAY